MKTNTLSLNPGTWFKTLRSTQNLPRPWMSSLAGLPGVARLKVEGDELQVTPTRDFAGRAIANLLSEKVDGYPIVVKGKAGPLSSKEALAYLGSLSDVGSTRSNRHTIQANVPDERTANFYNNVLGKPRGLDEVSLYFTTDPIFDTPYWRD